MGEKVKPLVERVKPGSEGYTPHFIFQNFHKVFTNSTLKLTKKEKRELTTLSLLWEERLQAISC